MKTKLIQPVLAGILALGASGCGTMGTDGNRTLLLHTRTQKEPARTGPEGGPGLTPASASPLFVTGVERWDPSRTALVICDMWDDHWCGGAARRVEELAGALNEVVMAARARGIFIIHAPSATVDFYRDTPQRKLALNAPFSPTPVPLATSQRWGTAWCWPDARQEPEMPIDDSDMGCDCEQKCMIREAWTRQIATIDILDGDAITDNGQETFNLLHQRGIRNVILTGVHLNMCVLGRPFGIRQMANLGMNVVLMRDMTDTMYNSKKAPFVDHFTGTDLVVGHVERAWCPSILSTDLVGGEPFRFREDTR